MRIPTWGIVVGVVVIAAVVWHCMGRPMPGSATQAGKAAAA